MSEEFSDDEVNEQFTNIALGDMQQTLEQFIEHMVNIDLHARHSLDAHDVEATAEASMAASRAVAGVTWGAIPTLVMGMANRINSERGELMGHVQFLWDHWTELQTVIAQLAENPSVDAKILLDLASISDCMDQAIANSRFNESVDRDGHGH